MCPLIGRRYYEWMLRVNTQFPALVEADRGKVVEAMRSDASLADLALGLGLTTRDDSFTEFLASVPAEQQLVLKAVVGDVVEDGGDVYFDAVTIEDRDRWAIDVHNMRGGTRDGVIVVLRGPYEMLARAS